MTWQTASRPEKLSPRFRTWDEKGSERQGARQLLKSQTFGAGGGSARALICDWNPTLR